MYEEEPTDLVDDIIRPDPKLGDVIEVRVRVRARVWERELLSQAALHGLP